MILLAFSKSSVSPFAPLGQTDKKICILNTDGYYDALRTLLQKGTDEGFIAASVAECYRMIDTPKELADVIG